MRSVLDPTLPENIGARWQQQRIVDAMIDSCAEKTYAATTISDVVRRASISRTTFYKRFPNKRACFDAALEHCVAELQETARGAVQRQAESPAAAVRAAVAATLALLAERPALGQLVLGEAVAVAPTTLDRYRRGLVPSIEAVLAATGEAPRIHSDPHLAFGRAQVLICTRIAASQSKELPALLPEIVYLVLLPFAGHDAALEQARSASEGRGAVGAAAKR